MMIRSRYQELRNYLKTKLDLLGVTPEQFVGDIDKLSVVDGGHGKTTKGVHLCNFRYTGSFYFERLPFSKIPLVVLYVKSFLDDHDDTRGDFDLPDPKFDIIPLDVSDQLVDLMAEVEFCDPVYLEECPDDAEPAIEWNGRRWLAGEFAVEVAESGLVEGAPAR